LSGRGSIHISQGIFVARMERLCSLETEKQSISG
jgi:hypothetical protein